jgi:hypothetical protein
MNELLATLMVLNPDITEEAIDEWLEHPVTRIAIQLGIWVALSG